MSCIAVAVEVPCVSDSSAGGWSPTRKLSQRLAAPPPASAVTWPCSRQIGQMALKLRSPETAFESSNRTSGESVGCTSTGRALSGHLFGLALPWGLRAQDYLPSTVSIPASTNSSLERGSLPRRAVRRSLSTLTTWDTLATESFGSPVRRAGRWAFPGAKAHLRLLVSGTQRTVAMRLRFNASPCTTTTGLRNPGPEPAGAGRSAHQISPCEITTRFAPGRGARRRKRTDLSLRPLGRTPCSSPR